MKRREFTRLAAFAATLAATTFLLPSHAALAQEKLKIGFAGDDHRAVARPAQQDIIAEAAKHPEVELTSPTARTRPRSSRRCRNLSARKSTRCWCRRRNGRPRRRRAAGDRTPRSRCSCSTANVETDQYTQPVGGDNEADRPRGRRICGRAARRQGKAAGNVVEILAAWRSRRTTVTTASHENTDKEAGIKYLLTSVRRRKQDQAYNIIDGAASTRRSTLYGQRPDGLRRLSRRQDAGREKDIAHRHDALPGEGVTWVNNGELSATFPMPRRAPKAAPGHQLLNGENERPSRSTRCW